MKYTIEARVSKANLERHCLVTGASGSGKSLLLLCMAHSLVATSKKRRDCSIILLEPHADLATKLMAARVLDDDRLVYFSSTMQREAGLMGKKIIASFNPFLIPMGADEAFKNLLATQLSSTIAEMVEAAQHGITLNMEMILRPCILVTLSSPNPSMTTLKRLLTDGFNDDLLQIGYNYPHPQIQDFFRNHWHSTDYDMTKRALINKLNFFLNDVDLYDMLDGNGLDIEACLENGSVLIVNAPSGANPFIANFVGRILISTLFCHILRREAKPANKRKQCYLLIDEMPLYLTSSLTHMLHEARKYKLAVVLSGQTLKALDAKMLTAINTNTFLKCISISDAENRAIMSKNMGVSNDELAALEPLMFMVSKNDGAKSTPFRIKVPILSKHLFLEDKEIRERLAKQIRTGVYREVPPVAATPPAPPFAPKDEKKKKYEKKPQKKNDDEHFNGSTPAFN